MEGLWRIIASLLIVSGVALLALAPIYLVARRRRTALAWSESANLLWFAAGAIAARDGGGPVDAVHLLRAAVTCPAVGDAIRRGGGDPEAIRSRLEDFDGVAPVEESGAVQSAESGYYRPPRHAFVPRAQHTPLMQRISRKAAQTAHSTGHREMTLGALLSACADEPALEAILGDVTFEHDDIAIGVGPSSPGCVYLLNDEVTTMEAVAALLTDVFELDESDAIVRMLIVHHHGFAALGPFASDRRDVLMARARERVPSLRLSHDRPDTISWRVTDHGMLPPTA